MTSLQLLSIGGPLMDYPLLIYPLIRDLTGQTILPGFAIANLNLVSPVSWPLRVKILRALCPDRGNAMFKIGIIKWIVCTLTLKYCGILDCMTQVCVTLCFADLPFLPRSVLVYMCCRPSTLYGDLKSFSPWWVRETRSFRSLSLTSYMTGLWITFLLIGVKNITLRAKWCEQLLGSNVVPVIHAAVFPRVPC